MSDSVARDENTPGFALSASDTSAQLMQLGKTEALGILHDHQAGIRHVDAHLDDGRGNQDVDLPRRKALHHVLLFPTLHSSVERFHAQSRESLPQCLGVSDRAFHGSAAAHGRVLLQKIVKIHLARVLLLLDGGADDVDLSSLPDLPLDETVEPLAVALVHRKGIHSLSSRRHLIDAGDGKVPVQNERE